MGAVVGIWIESLISIFTKGYLYSALTIKNKKLPNKGRLSGFYDEIQMKHRLKRSGLLYCRRKLHHAIFRKGPIEGAHSNFNSFI